VTSRIVAIQRPAALDCSAEIENPRLAVARHFTGSWLA
jgi:hypothetical protein